MTSVQRIIKSVAVAFAIFLSVAIIGGIVSAVSTLNLFFGDGDTAKGEMKNYTVSGDIKNLEIEVGAVEFTVKEGDFSVSTDNKYITVSEKNGTLYVKEKTHRFNNNDDVTLTICIPNGKTFENADIDLGAGAVEISSLKVTGDSEIDGGAGELKFTACSFNDLELDLGAGKVTFDGEILGKSEINCGVGQLNLTLLNKDDYEIRINKGLGDAKINGERVSSDSVYGNGKNKLSIDGGVGEINVTFK